MTWLFPLYLLGAGAIALPILLHLRRKEPKEKVVFSSLMFLERSPQLLTQRSKLERLLLLALRCLALILLALMFSRPFFPMTKKGVMSDQGEAVLLLLDGSASMQRGDLWSQATKLAEARIKGATPRDRLSLMRFDREAKTLWSFDRDANESAGRVGPMLGLLGSEFAGWGATDLGKALVEGVKTFDSSESVNQEGLRRRVVLISDLQEGANLDALRGFAWPDDIEVEVAQLTAPDVNNLSMSLAASEIDEAGTLKNNASSKAVGGVRVRVSNVRNSALDSFAVGWEKGGVAPIEGYLPPAASRVLRTSPQPGETGGDVLVLKGDSWDFDNRLYVAPPQPRKVKVVYRGTEDPAGTDAASPLFYLKRALQPTSSLNPVLVPGADWEGASLALIQSESLKASDVPSLLKWLSGGGLGVVMASRGADAAPLLPLLSANSLSISEADVGEYAMLGEVNGDNPLLSPFADARLRDFTKIRFWHHRKVAWSSDEKRAPEVLARFDNGDPAMLLWQMGKGRLVLMASGWHPSDSQLALSTKFVPLLFGWLQAAGFSHEESPSLTVGDEWVSAAPVDSIKKPDGTLIEKPTGSVRLDSPGFYQIRQGEENRIVAVNLAPEEGRIHPMDPQKLAEAGVKLTSSSGASETKTDENRQKIADTREDETRQKAWFWVLILLLVVLAWETWLAGRKSPVETVNA